jgi:hypothetical protein
MNCPGMNMKTGSTCNSNLYRCQKCGNVGCDHHAPGTCSNQGFRSGKCEKCGKNDKKTFT